MIFLYSLDMFWLYVNVDIFSQQKKQITMFIFSHQGAVVTSTGGTTPDPHPSPLRLRQVDVGGTLVTSD